MDSCRNRMSVLGNINIAILLLQVEVFLCQLCTDERILPLPDFDNVEVREYVLWEVSAEKLECLRKCYFDVRCHSFQTLGSSGRCTGHATAFSSPDKIYSPTTVSAGTSMYLLPRGFHYVGSACTSDGDCTLENTSCNDGTCNCDIGIMFSIGRRACVTGCTEWGNEAVRYLEHSISGYNDVSLTGVTEAECRQRCLAANTSTFTCTTADHLESDCFLSSVTFLSVPESNRKVGTPYTHYQRTCL
ncbi:uncharacterized protein [Haliotis cracherodii]|uniref:uncharacterized protein n=1 Tax=Haliotis cracherodii TaxID=6455 RepID=UPI0039E836E2